MEIHSTKIDFDVLHVIRAPDGVLLFEGWGPAGVEDILKKLAVEDAPHENIPVEAISAFYCKIQSDMPEVYEITVALGETDIHDIRLRYEDSFVEHHPNRFCFYES